MTVNLWPEKAGSAELLATSDKRGWIGLSAQLCSHGEGIIHRDLPLPDTEVCVGTRDSRSIISRQSEGHRDKAVAKRGAIWISPAGHPDTVIGVSEPIPEILHVNLPSCHFSEEALGANIDASVMGSLRAESGLDDPLLAEIGYAIASELRLETPAGAMLMESLALAMAARLVQNHLGRLPSEAYSERHPKGLDRQRLSRVLDYVSEHLETDLTVAQLASVACLSRFHFSRAFKASVGLSPHIYVSNKRLDRAKTLLSQSDQPLVDIALTLKFSCQANFARAFRQNTGQTPSEYRRASHRNAEIMYLLGRPDADCFKAKRPPIPSIGTCLESIDHCSDAAYSSTF